jgi:hypothetical protein
MYFAQMYCYGFDNDIVGITGIVGCMGVIYVGQGAMYAVHIPDGGAAENKAAGKTFADWVKNQQGQVGKGHGRLLVFANGTNRSIAKGSFSKAEEEAKDIKKALKSPPTTMYRIMKHLGPNSGGQSANSAAIMVERVHATTDNPSGCAIWYKKDFGHITWVAGGKAESGQYKAKPSFCGAIVPSDLNAQWWRMSDMTCTVAQI